MATVSNIEKKAKKETRARVITVLVLLFGLLTSGYYLYTLLLRENIYKIYVEGLAGSGSNMAEGLFLTYDPSYGHGYSNLSGKGLRTESNSMAGMSFATESLEDKNGKKYPNALNYLMSVASNDEKSVDTNVTDRGQSGEANNDQFIASKFYLLNNSKDDPLNGQEGISHYAFRLNITANSRNALSACRFAILRVTDESNIYDYDSNAFSNDCFEITVIAQPKTITLENGDEMFYKGDEPDSQEYVSSTVSGDYTNTPGTALMKNPNKGHEKEDWKCTNLHYQEDTRSWMYDSLIHESNEEDQVFEIKPGEKDAYVIAAWYEATDPNHGNNILSGYVSFEFTFYAVEK